MWVMARDDPAALDPLQILNAYSLGYFPMARSRDDASVMWVLPDIRGLLPLSKARSPKKLARQYRSNPFEMRINTQFNNVIAACAEAKNDRPDTWINAEIEEAYIHLHDMGVAHSIECFEGDELVGGLYGIQIGSIFCGESMFSRRTNASKIAMLFLIDLLKKANFDLLDTQFYTDHLAQFGVLECENASYQYALRLYRDQERLFTG